MFLLNKGVVNMAYKKYKSILLFTRMFIVVCK